MNPTMQVVKRQEEGRKKTGRRPEEDLDKQCD
jgi:hypothetical protein